MLKPEHVTFKRTDGFAPNTFTVTAVPNRIVSSVHFHDPAWGAVDHTHEAKREAFRVLWDVFYGELQPLVTRLVDEHFTRGIEEPTVAQFDYRGEIITKLQLLLKCPCNQIPKAATDEKNTRPVPGVDNLGKPPSSGQASDGATTGPTNEIGPGRF